MSDQDALEALASPVTASDLTVQREVHDSLEARRPEAGRLADVAVWWAAAREDPHAAPPREAALLVLRDRGPGGADGAEGAEVTESAPASPLSPPAGAVLTELTADVPDDVAQAVAWGAATADAVADRGTDVLLLAVRDTTAARVLAAGLMGQDPVEAVGWPAPGLDDEEWTALVVALRDGLRRVRGLRGQPLLMLERLGSPVLAAGTAVLVQAAARRTPVLLDGYSSLVCAVLARRLSRATAYWTLVAQADDRLPVQRALKSLSQTPVVDLGIRAEDGAGARLGLSLLETACGLLRA